MVAVASGKGGVGKSTLTANLAAALAAGGAEVGVVDADIYGYSIPRMLGITRRPVVVDGMIVPPVNHGLRIMSIGFFLEPDQAVVWRGPMLHKALEQFLTDVHWGDLDYLIVDMPPGTGRRLDLARPAAAVARRHHRDHAPGRRAAGGRALGGGRGQDRHARRRRDREHELPGVPVLRRARRTSFGEGGGRALADRLGVPLLGEIPLDEPLRIASDAGRPLVLDRSRRALGAGDRRDRRRPCRRRCGRAAAPSASSGG